MRLLLTAKSDGAPKTWQFPRGALVTVLVRVDVIVVDTVTVVMGRRVIVVGWLMVVVDWTVVVTVLVL